MADRSQSGQALTLGEETKAAWQACMEAANGAVAAFSRASRTGFFGEVQPVPVSAKLAREAFESLQRGSERPKPLLQGFFYTIWSKETSAPFRAFWQRRELGPEHFIRFLILVGAILRRGGERRLYGSWMETLLPVYHRSHPDVGLRELAAALPSVGLKPDFLAEDILANFGERSWADELPPALVWPYWAEHLGLLEQALVPVTGGYLERWDGRNARRHAFRALVCFPEPPERLVPLLWRLALGSKHDRGAAQPALERLPDLVPRLCEAVAKGNSASRLGAVEWLGRLNATTAVPTLLVALGKEKQEAAKGAILAALEKLEVPVNQFLDRAALAADAAAGLAKGIPTGLAWFPFDRLPAVRWREGAGAVPCEVVQWWLVQGFKLKTPEPGVMLRLYCAQLRDGDREALGQWVLETWLAADTAPISRAEAESLAQQEAQGKLHLSQTPYWPAHLPKKTLTEYYAESLPRLLLQPRGSAIESKGVLSVAAACCGGAAVPAISSYLKQWYGQRAAQCRALIQTLAWVEHKAATQLLLAVAGRFRTKSIQQEATLQTEALADRKGWTVPEMADRTIPTAGMDEQGVLILDFGPRAFSARLNDDCEFTLADPEGKPVKSLPEPRRDDDAALAAAAKKSLAAARKELKAILTLQKERLYEAMCTQRAWSVEDWRTYLHLHPVLRHLCRRVVWVVVSEGQVLALFRPLADGTLTDAADEAVPLPVAAEVRVAHETLVSPPQSLAWQQHLADYDVEPLFQQFGRPTFKLPGEPAQDDELTAFRGHVVEAFKLRTRAVKLGYVRGQTQDGGWFYDYRKRLTALGMEAVLEFTGNSLPEENRKVALRGFHFERLGPEGRADGFGLKAGLSEVPPVLLSECWNDLAQLAAAGAGFDPDWEKHTQP